MVVEEGVVAKWLKKVLLQVKMVLLPKWLLVMVVVGANVVIEEGVVVVVVEVVVGAIGG